MLRSGDIIKYLPGVNILRYEDLENVRRIENVIPPQGLILLYPGKSNISGHWVCLFIKGNTIFFFDSYGNLVDQAEQYDINNNIKPNMWRRLTKLLYETPLNVDFNNYQLQSYDINVQTCGYWCVARLKNKNLSTDQFFKVWMVEPGGTIPDELVKYYVENMI